jgi:hypothetical protein
MKYFLFLTALLAFIFSIVLHQKKDQIEVNKDRSACALRHSRHEEEQ